MFKLSAAARGVTILFAFACFVCVAQTPAFEAASVRPSTVANNDDVHLETSPGSLTIRGMSLKFCIGWAYDRPAFQVEGPAWLKDVGFDIVAKAGGQADEAQLRLMLRALLAERFGLTMHTETKEMQVYALKVAKGGPKFQQSNREGPPTHSRGAGGAMTVERGAMSELAEESSKAMNRPVIDATGLKGHYDYRINTLPYVEAATAANGAGGEHVGEMDATSILIAALQGELGLKLEARRDAVGVLVVDHAEKVPTAN